MSNTTVLPREKFEASLAAIMATPDAKKTTAYMIWLVNDHAVGFSSLKNIAFGKSGEMHLHIWDASMRGKGYGPTLFCKSALEFYQRFKLEQIKCEPRSINPYPNKMFARIGFPLVRTHTAASSELSIICELNTYDVRAEIAQSFLSSKD